MRVRSGYSFRHAVGHLDEVLSRIQELGWSYAPITDTASTFGFVKWNKLCKKAELKPVFGVELAVTQSLNAKKPIVDYWTFIAIDSIASVNRLVEIATSQFRYQPMLTVEQACAAAGVVKIVGHRTDLSAVPPGDHLFVALAPSTSRGYFRLAQSLGHKFIAASDNRFTRPGDQAFYEVVCGRNASTQSYPQWLLSDDEWCASVAWAGEMVEEALGNRETTFLLCNAKLAPGHLLQPEKPESLEAMCRAGAVKLKCDLTDPVYEARLRRELDMIASKDFEDYFYIIADMCQWARERMIVGPARGSSCGSLVCYLLGITTVDPIPYDLIFERFIDINRNDLPDIDIDFSDQKRQLVFDYMAEKYGSERVARLGTVALYKPRSALQEAAAALDIPPWKINPVLDSIIDRSGGDSRALQATEDTLNDTDAGRKLLSEFPEIMMAGRMEGHPRHHSQHAAGIILTDKPVSEYVAVDKTKGSTHCDKKDAEELNLLKIDALGLTQLSVFEDTLKMAGLPLNHLDSIPLDDQAAFGVLNKGHFSGVFQFNGLALQSVTQQVAIEHLEDIVSITALARPGPLNTGGTNHWIKVKTGREPATYVHPLVKPHLETTLGIVCYQEQVMVIGREIGGLSWEDVTALRKAMSKSLGEEFFGQYRGKFVEGAVKNGMDEDLASKFFNDLSAFGSWAFNRSHAVAYGLVSYYCCWLKAHYPMEFAAAALTHTDSFETQIKMLREMAQEGVGYVAADKDLSMDQWTVGFVDGEKKLIGPLTQVKGIGPKLMSQIMSARARGEPMPSRAEKLLNDPQTKIDSIWPIGDRIKKIMPDPREKNISSSPVPIADVQTNGEEYEVMVFCTVAEIKPKDENEDVNIAKRGYKVTGPSLALNLRIEDDSDAMFAKVSRWEFERIGRPIIERGRAGKALYAIKGRVPKDFRMITIKQVRYLGDMEKDT